MKSGPISFYLVRFSGMWCCHFFIFDLKTHIVLFIWHFQSYHHCVFWWWLRSWRASYKVLLTFSSFREIIISFTNQASHIVLFRLNCSWNILLTNRILNLKLHCTAEEEKSDKPCYERNPNPHKYGLQNIENHEK